MKKISGVVILIMVAAMLMLWHARSDQACEPIVEAPHPQVDSLFKLMDQKLRSRQYREGIRLARQALEISLRDGYRYGEVNSLMALGFVLGHEAKYDSAIILLEKARELVSRYRLDPEQRHRAGSFLAESYQAVGKIERAFECLNEGVEYFRENDNPYQLCATYNSLGLLYQSQGVYEKAEEIYRNGLGIARTLPDDRYYERSFTGNLGILCAILGKLNEAIPLIETSLRMGIEMHDPVAQGIDHQYLGSIQFARGNFREALKHHLENARLMEQTGENHNLIRAYRNIAKVYNALNDFENAEIYYRKAVEVVDTKLEGKYRQFPQAYLGYASYKIRRNDYEQADKLLKKAIAGYSSLNAPKELAACYLTQTRLEYKRGDFERSLESARAAFRLLTEIGAGETDLAGAHFWFGQVYQALNTPDSSLQHYNKAISLSSEVTDSDMAWKTHHALSGFFNDRGELESALRHSQQAVAAIERLRRYTISADLSSRFLTDKVQVYQRCFDLLYQKYQREPSDAILNDLFLLSEQTRGRVLFEKLNSGMESIFSQLHQSSILQDLEEQIIAINLFMRKELTKQQEERRTNLIKQWRQQLASLQQQYDLHTKEFIARNPELSSMLTVDRIVSPAQIQEQLPTDTALLSYYSSDEALYAFVIDRSRFRLTGLPVSSTQLWGEIKKLRQPFQELKTGKIDFLRMTFDTDLSHQLCSEIFVPLSEFLADRNRLIIVPAGALHYLPFELLMMAEPDDSGKPPYLLARYAISYLPSASLVPLLNKKEAGETTRSLLAFANPIIEENRSRSANFVSTGLPARLRNMLFTSLPGASREVQGIRGVFEPDSITAFLETDATESAYKRNAARFRFVHFATHGYINEQNPNFSALLLNAGDEKEDGFLHAYEIYARPINTELVSMSACETALGEYRESEGLVSLVQAFFAAGSRSVLASLWSVEEAAYPLMVSFYRNIKNGMPGDEALRQAKLEFMLGTTRYGAVEYSRSHPFLWAPFVLYGVSDAQQPKSPRAAK